MQIELDGIPPSLNKYAGRKNCWQYRQDKQDWKDRVILACKGKSPNKPYEYAEITITYFFNSRRRHDADNYAGKFLLDGLTAAGVIVDDDLAHISTTIRGEYDKNKPRTVISVKKRAGN